MQNDTAYDLSVTGVYADGDLYGADGASALGDFVDAISVWSEATGGLRIAAGQTYTGGAPATPLATYHLKQDAPPEAAPVLGHILLGYELYDLSAAFQGSGTLTAQFEGQDVLASAGVPVPATGALLALGLAGLVRRRRGRAEPGLAADHRQAPDDAQRPCSDGSACRRGASKCAAPPAGHLHHRDPALVPIAELAAELAAGVTAHEPPRPHPVHPRPSRQRPA